MIPHSSSIIKHSESWQHRWSQALNSVSQLLQYVALTTEQVPLATSALAQFPLRVPKAFADKIEKGNPKDPLLLQVLPRAEEDRVISGYTRDPLLEQQKSPHKSFIYKYKGRILLMLSGSCAIHCRYCFRRYYPYQEQKMLSHDWCAASAFLKKNVEIQEVILSGGDPLAYKTAALAPLVDLLQENPQIKRLRIHTRFPVVIPQRVDEQLLSWLDSMSVQKILVIHANHANELDHDFKQAMLELAHAQVVLLNQSVLLQGVNNDVSSLCALSEALFDCKVLPYYLHLLDPVQGSHHFAVKLEVAQRLLGKLSVTLPGYMVPKLVKEETNIGSKVLYAPVF